MLQTLQKSRHDTREMTAITRSAAIARKAEESYVEEDDGLLATAGPIMMACYGIAFTMVVLTFMSNGEAMIAIAVSIGFAVMFFSVPILLMRVRARQDVRWRPANRTSKSDTVDTYTGPMNRGSAVAHMVIVPFAVVLAFSGFSLIWVLLRP